MNCDEYANAIKPVYNPNGDSELALFMREMHKEAYCMKEHIAKGEPISSELDYESLFTAEATEPQKAASAEYQAYAKTYLQVMKTLGEANLAEQRKVYDTMLDNCVACHQTLCPGPLVKIHKLRI